MYRQQGEEIFVIDGHTHFWWKPANQKNIHLAQVFNLNPMALLCLPSIRMKKN